MTVDQGKSLLLCCAFLCIGWTSYAPAQQIGSELVTVDARSTATPFPHFWEQMFGSGRAILTLREDYREDLRAVKKVADFRYVRFHGILDDEVGVYKEDAHGEPVYNFTYVDSIYDGLLKDGVRPMVEISFMPKKLAANPDALHPFWYKPNVSPPKSMERWDGLIQHFAQHLVDRYGIDEVSQWYFEVWNEPNIDFWGGVPRQKSYFNLYDHTARSLKSVSPRLRVGGPATAAAQWVPQFLQHASENHVPVDFVSTHGYADDTVENLFGTHEDIPTEDRVGRAVAMVRKQIDDSAFPKLPLFWTEWNVPGKMQVRDTIFVGPALANTVRECDGNVNMMSFWTFSDVFEEGGPTTGPFRGGFGLRAFDGIDKPSYYDFGLLHQLGEQRLANPSKNVLVTRTANGDLAIAAWNLVDPGQQGSGRGMDIRVLGVPPNSLVSLQRVDQEHGNVLARWAAMGKPHNPTPAQVEQLNRETALPPPEQSELKDGKLHLELGPNALVLVKLARSSH
ncbi:MAG: GH39 family glycosyl hydrolase [Acidobacteriaceae bacterium]